MTLIHDEVEIEDLEFDKNDEMYYYPCPCGDRFRISTEELLAGDEVAMATCPSCPLVLKVIYENDLAILKAESEETDKETVKA